MSIGELRPVGEYVRSPEGAGPTAKWPSGYNDRWFVSGTAALAVAIRACMRVKPRPKPTVLVPAYTCPDVVSAVIWAGARPLLVDCEPESPWLSVDRVAEAIDDSAVAIVAPHFLGIPQPLSDLLDICKRNDVTLVEDSAQLGPTSPAFAPKADLVILSFGRGKPIPVGGGVLISRSNMREALAAETLGILASRVSSWGWQVRRMLQNAAMSPLGYRMVRSLPFLGVGETRFRPLRRVRLLEGEGVALAEGIIALWKQDVTPAQRYLCELADSAELLNLPSKMQLDGRAPLLRYPLLLDCQSTRDRLLEMLVRHGIGATNLYGQSLPAILRARSEVSFVKASWPNADDFARRLITIPVHSGVQETDLEIIRRCIATCLRARMVEDSRT